jgi:hypothetical protein
MNVNNKQFFSHRERPAQSYKQCLRQLRKGLQRLPRRFLMGPNECVHSEASKTVWPL